jgi:hypothetical protein
MSQPTFKYKKFYDAQIEFLAQKDAKGLITTNYTEDAELLSFQNHITGRANLITYFTGYIANLGYIKLISTDQYAEGDNSLMFEATVETAGGIARVYDSWFLRDGKIAKHFTGLLGFTPNPPKA